MKTPTLEEQVESICNFDFEGKLWSDDGFDQFKRIIKHSLEKAEKRGEEKQLFKESENFDQIIIQSQLRGKKQGLLKAIGLYSPDDTVDDLFDKINEAINQL